NSKGAALVANQYAKIIHLIKK
ncbi:hypothetical protein, partial [Bacillus paramycoides]